MPSSRISRIEEKRTRTRLFLVIAASILIITLIAVFGVPALVKFSSVVGDVKSNGQQVDAGDKTAPFPPTLAPLTSATNSAQIKVEGFAEPQSTLKLFMNGDEAKKVVIGDDGAFSFTDIKLDAGDNTIYATATDPAGNESALSKESHVMFKKETPKLEITEPAENQSFDKNHQEITISGKTDPGNDMRINDRFVRVFDDGAFTFSLKLNDGENTLTIIAIDKAGNQTKLERKVTFSP